MYALLDVCMSAAGRWERTAQMPCCTPCNQNLPNVVNKFSFNNSGSKFLEWAVSNIVHYCTLNGAVSDIVHFLRYTPSDTLNTGIISHWKQTHGI